MQRPSRLIGGRIDIVQMQVRGVILDGFPPTSAVELHPIIFSILDFARILERLGE